MSSDFQNVAWQATDASRMRVSSDQPADTSVDRGARIANLSGAQRATINTSGMETSQHTNRTPGFSARDTGSVTRSVTVNGASTDTVSNGYARSSEGSDSKQGVASIRSAIFGVAKSGPSVKGTDIVRIGNLETTVDAAIASGFLRRGADGSLTDVGAQQIEAEYKAEADKKAETSIKEPTVAPLDDASESLMQTFVKSVHPTDGAMAVKQIVDGQEVDADLLARAASRLGTEPSIVKEQIASLTEAFNNQARDYVGDRVLDHARQHDMAALKEAAREQAMTGSMHLYKAIAERHMAGLDKTDPQAILTSDDGRKLNARLDKRTGEVTLDIPGVGRTTWAAAIKAQLIQPYFPATRRR
jgi:hypothetical protein